MPQLLMKQGPSHRHSVAKFCKVQLYREGKQLMLVAFIERKLVIESKENYTSDMNSNSLTTSMLLYFAVRWNSTPVLSSGKCPCRVEVRCEQPKGLVMTDLYLHKFSFVAFLWCNGTGKVSCHPMHLYFRLLCCFKEERIYSLFVWICPFLWLDVVWLDV